MRSPKPIARSGSSWAITVNEIGEDASIDLTRTEPKDARSRAIRETQSRAEAEGYHVELLAPPHSPERLARLKDISNAWLAETGARKKRFGAVLFKYGRNFYNFAGLRAYKKKYGPDWSPRYVAGTSAMPPLTALRDVTRAITGTPERRPRG